MPAILAAARMGAWLLICRISSQSQSTTVSAISVDLYNLWQEAGTGIATVGGGVRLGNLALGIYAQGERALPHGTCPGVGIGGHFLHGGYGHASRLWGLSLDTIVGLDVVLANGTYIHASPTQWQSVFHAMRGAGDSFGIVTFFYLQTELAPASIINFSASIPAVLDSVTTVTNAFLSLQSIVADPTHINGSISFGFYTDSSGAFSLVGWCIECDLDSFNAVVFPELLTVFPTPSSQSAVSMGWIDSLTVMIYMIPSTPSPLLLGTPSHQLQQNGLTSGLLLLMKEEIARRLGMSILIFMVVPVAELMHLLLTGRLMATAMNYGYFR
jgi:hypothetical protein